jgi:hypothetical protein
MPPLVEMLVHHLHCILHSAILAATITVLIWELYGAFWLPLLGWWSHIVIDVFTHSVDFYPSPVFYPLTQNGFDGIAWNTPWFMVLTYSALILTSIWLPLNARQAKAKHSNTKARSPTKNDTCGNFEMLHGYTPR